MSPITATGGSIEERLAAAALPPLLRPAWLEVDTDALASNLRTVRSLVPAGTRVAAVLKADGYGHGLEVAARTFRSAGAEQLCVATLDEALRVRRAGVDGPVLVLFPILPDAAPEAAAAGIEIVVTDEGDAAVLLERWSTVTGGSRATGGSPETGAPGQPGNPRGPGNSQQPGNPPRSGNESPLRVHLEVETGLMRGGVRVDAVARIARRIAGTPGVELAGVWSHLASAHDPAFSSGQEGRLADALTSITEAGLPLPRVHLAATGGLFCGTSRPHDMVRPGLCLYGVLPETMPVADSARGAAAGLRPAMSLKARSVRITSVAAGTPVGYGGVWIAERRSVIATLPVGYGDGYTRTYQPGAEALVRGRRVPIVGSIAMDALAVDVTEIQGVSAADEFVLLGAQGTERITAGDLARRRNTITWEVLSSMAYRLPRVYDAATGPRGVRTLAGEFLVREDTI